jgi:hypothetical protein
VTGQQIKSFTRKSMTDRNADSLRNCARLFKSSLRVARKNDMIMVKDNQRDVFVSQIAFANM